MKHKRKFYGFLIDADNTIFDFDRAEREAFYETLNLIGISDTKLIEKLHSIYIKINDKIWKSLERGEIGWERLNVKRFEDFLQIALETIENLPDKIPHSKATIINTMAENYIDILSQKAYTIPHAVETLAYLSSRADLILGTNGIAKVQRNRIAKAGIEIFFKEIIISEEIGVSKPNPGFFNLAIKKLDLPKSEILCVGDSITSDIIGGSKAGLSTCLFLKDTNHSILNTPETNETYDYTIEDIRELKDFAPPLF